MRRRARVGHNTVPTEPPRSLVRSVVAELRETMILVLLAAAVLTAVSGDFTDCAVILLVIAVNTTVGVVQERRAVGAVRALTTLAAPTCTVVREACRVGPPRPSSSPGTSCSWPRAMSSAPTRACSSATSCRSMRPC